MTRTHNFFGLLAIAAFTSSFIVFATGFTYAFILTFTLGICFTIVFLAMKAAVR